MPQVSLYLNDRALGILRGEAEREKRSLSRFVSELIENHAQRPQWPKGYWDQVYGSLEDDSFQVAGEYDGDLDGKLPSFD